jgi:hypothetical protein
MTMMVSPNPALTSTFDRVGWQASRSHLLTELRPRRALFLLQVLDNALLVSIDPACNH